MRTKKTRQDKQNTELSGQLSSQHSHLLYCIKWLCEPHHTGSAGNTHTMYILRPCKPLQLLYSITLVYHTTMGNAWVYEIDSQKLNSYVRGFPSSLQIIFHARRFLYYVYFFITCVYDSVLVNCSILAVCMILWCTYIPGTEGVGMESVVAPVADVLLDWVEEDEEEEGSPLFSSTSLDFLAASSSSALRSDTISGVRELGIWDPQFLTSGYIHWNLGNPDSNGIIYNISEVSLLHGFNCMQVLLFYCSWILEENLLVGCKEFCTLLQL